MCIRILTESQVTTKYPNRPREYSIKKCEGTSPRTFGRNQSNIKGANNVFMLVILFSEYEGQLQTRQNERVRIFYTILYPDWQYKSIPRNRTFDK